jgi:hypothetical protein
MRAFLILTLLLAITGFGIVVAIHAHYRIESDQHRQQEHKASQKFFQGGNVDSDHRGW